jgi:hypothetical protein
MQGHRAACELAKRAQTCSIVGSLMTSLTHIARAMIIGMMMIIIRRRLGHGDVV